MKFTYANYLLEKVSRDYNEIAESFAQTRSSIWPEIQFLADYVKDGNRILDIGCGSGRLYELFKEKKVEYFGIDFAKRLIEIAKRKYNEDSLNLSSEKEETKKEISIPTFLAINAFNLPCDDNFFDKVFSIAVFHHIPSREKRILFLKEIKRVLKPKGELFLTVWNLWQKKYFSLIFKYASLKIFGKTDLDFRDIFIPFGKRKRYYHCFRKKELTELAQEAGFEVKELKYLKRNNKNYNIYLRIIKP